LKRGVPLDIQVGIPILCAAGGLIIGYLAFRRDKDNDVRNDASESAVIKTKLDNISSGVDSIRIDMKANEKRVSDLSERVIRVEESSKQAHKRIDKIENQGGNSNEN
jgi:septal ring factor EnvC (AmiA/AmiB activator)